VKVWIWTWGTVTTVEVVLVVVTPVLVMAVPFMVAVTGQKVVVYWTVIVVTGTLAPAVMVGGRAGALEGAPGGVLTTMDGFCRIWAAHRPEK